MKCDISHYIALRHERAYLKGVEDLKSPMIRHRITLYGGNGECLRIDGETFSRTILALIEGAQRATRFAVEGFSARRGKKPEWLQHACKIEFVGFSPGSVVADFEAPDLTECLDDKPPFAVGALEVFRQSSNIRPVSGVELFSTVLCAAIEDRVEEVDMDTGLLDACLTFVEASSKEYPGGVKIERPNSNVAPVHVYPDNVIQLREIRERIPPPQMVRVAGILDTMTASKNQLHVKLEDGAEVRAQVRDVSPESLVQYFNQKVAITGKATFRPSGKPRLVDVETIEFASENDTVFEREPQSTQSRALKQSHLIAGIERRGVASFFGTWPGDETEEELLNDLRENR